MEIIPAILPKNFKELEEGLEIVHGATSSVQIDVTDGKFAGVPSWLLIKVDENFKAILRQERGMPFWEDFDFEIDLMAEDPLSLVDDWITAGATRIIFHIETLDLEKDALLLDQLKTEGLIQLGFAIDIATPEDTLKDYFPYSDFIQVMGIDKDGYQGEKFDPECLRKIIWIKENLPNMIVSVDGGMNAETVLQVADAGADRAVVGSYILKSINPRETIAELQSLV